MEEQKDEAFTEVLADNELSEAPSLGGIHFNRSQLIEDEKDLNDQEEKPVKLADHFDDESEIITAEDKDSSSSSSDGP